MTWTCCAMARCRCCLAASARRRRSSRSCARSPGGTCSSCRRCSRHGRRCHRRAVSLVAGDGEREELPSFRPGPSAARGHAGRIVRRNDIAGHALNSGLCRVPGPGPLRKRNSLSQAASVLEPSSSSRRGVAGASATGFPQASLACSLGPRQVTARVRASADAGLSMTVTPA